MKIEEHIRDRFRHALREAPSLVIYDPDGRYREIALSLGDAGATVVDGSGTLLEGREAAMKAWLALPGMAGRLVVYLPFRKPLKEEERLDDPYLAFRVGGAEFPDGAGDEYAALCKQAFPDKAAQVEALFAARVPDFGTVDLLEAGATWPKLRALLKAEAAWEIVAALLAPSDRQRAALEADASWPAEARELLGATLGFTVPQGVRTLEDLSGKLWRFVLFSEFVQDLPGELPAALKGVPRAPAAGKDLVFKVCRSLREQVGARPAYVEHAGRIERELDLAERLKETEELGCIETFPFENVTAFRRFCRTFAAGDLDGAAATIEENARSIWREEEGMHQAVWKLAGTGLALLREADRADHALRDNADGTLGQVVARYAQRLYAVDAHYRRLCQVRASLNLVEFFGVPLEPILARADECYRSWSGRLQEVFLDAVVREGWPAVGTLRQPEVFQRFVAPCMEENRPVAFFLVDALRYELAFELQRALQADFTVAVEPACAQLPTKTESGMAALLPRAAGRLAVAAKDGALAVSLGGADVSSAARRDALLAAEFGDRCQVMGLDELVAMSPRKKLRDNVRLVVVRTRELDAAGEQSPELLSASIALLLSGLQKGIHKLRQLRVERFVIAADHGFYFFPSLRPGDSVARPSGDWVVQKDRFLLGHGAASPATARFAAREVGIPTDQEHYVVPRGLAAFQAGIQYFHGGLSLQEGLIPVVTVGVRAGAAKKPPKMALELGYRKTGIATSRSVMIELACRGEAPPLGFGEDWAADRLQVQLLVLKTGTEEEAGRVVPGDRTDSATGHVQIRAGEVFKVPILLAEDFNGPFTVKALDPNTMALLADIALVARIIE